MSRYRFIEAQREHLERVWEFDFRVMLSAAEA